MHNLLSGLEEFENNFFFFLSFTIQFRRTGKYHDNSSFILSQSNTSTFNTFPFLYHHCRKINVHLFTMLKIISFRWKNLDVERAEQQMVSQNPFTIHRKKSIQIYEPQHYRLNIQHSSKSIGIACQFNIKWTSNNTDL